MFVASVPSFYPHAFVGLCHESTQPSTLLTTSKSVPSSSTPSATMTTTQTCYRSEPSDPEGTVQTRSTRLDSVPLPASVSASASILPLRHRPFHFLPTLPLLDDDDDDDAQPTRTSRDDSGTGSDRCDGVAPSKSAGQAQASTHIYLPLTSTTSTSTAPTNATPVGTYGSAGTHLVQQPQPRAAPLLVLSPPPPPSSPSPEQQTDFPVEKYFLDSDLVTQVSPVPPLYKDPGQVPQAPQSVDCDPENAMNFATSSSAVLTPPATGGAPCDWRQPNDDEELTQAGRTALLKADMEYIHADDELSHSSSHHHHHRDHHHPSTSQSPSTSTLPARSPSPEPILTWDPLIDQADRAREARADAADFAHGAAGAHSHSTSNLNGHGNARGAGVYSGYGGGGTFQMDRRVIRDLVREKFGGAEVVRIRFLSSGTFHKAYLLTLNAPIVPPASPLTPTSQPYSTPTQPPPPPASYASSSTSPSFSSTQPPTRTLVARIARRFMPRLKTRSEVSTMGYLRAYTGVPVPVVYYVDENPFARVGGELVVMSEAPGIPLSRVYHSLPHAKLVMLLRNLAEMIIPIFGHRFSMIGSLYEGAGEGVLGTTDPLPTPRQNIGTGKGIVEDNSALHASSSSIPTPKPSSSIVPSFGSTPRMSRVQTVARLDTLAVRNALEAAKPSRPPHPSTQFHVGPIISWPFFGSHRGELSHTATPGLGFPPQPPEIDRGPWRSTRAYLEACAAREIEGAKRENEGKAKPHRLHLDPDERVRADRRGRRKKARGKFETLGEEEGGEYVWGYGYVGTKGIRAFGEDESSDDSDDEEGNGSGSPGSSSSSLSTSPVSSLGLNSEDSDEDAMYRDYRRYQRSTFLVAHLQRREAVVRKEMERVAKCVEGLQKLVKVQLGVMGVQVRGLAVGEEGDGEGKVVPRVNGVNGGVLTNGVSGRSSDIVTEDDAQEEEFSLDCHDLSLENVFVDEEDHTRISCVIDWESTTTRPLWACTHLPSFLLSSPFTANLFRKIVSAIARGEPDRLIPAHRSGSFNQSDTMASKTPHHDVVPANTEVDSSPVTEFHRTELAALATQWLALERVGGALRYAHKCVEWDGWEEGLVPSILGEPDEEEGESSQEEPLVRQVRTAIEAELEVLEDEKRKSEKRREKELIRAVNEAHETEDCEHDCDDDCDDDCDHDHPSHVGERALSPVPANKSRPIPSIALNVASTVGVVPPFGVGKPGLAVPGATGFGRPGGGETERERMLNTDGDLCGGVGGELGRRLEAWLVENHTGYDYDASDEGEGRGVH